MKCCRYIVLFVFIGLISFMGIRQSIVLPKHFPPPVYAFNTTSNSDVITALGKTLFYDPILSIDSTISCASCHSPYNAFAHTDHDLSHGIHDSIGTRNAPALFNLAWHKSFMWDGAINHLDMQALAPITHPAEMGEDFAHVVKKLQRSRTYSYLFHDAFGDDSITGARTLKALAHFQASLISAESKYDKVIEGKAEFTAQENAGYALFKTHCNSCHTEPLFSDYAFHNNGLPIDPTLNDFGKWRISNNHEDSLLFKTPSLRNLKYTFPYMHDGRFKRLQDVLNHYTDNIAISATTDEKLKNKISLSKNEKTDLIAFLLTLNDSAFVFNTAHIPTNPSN